MQNNWRNIMFKQCTDLFFDLDHTLWDFEKNSAISFELIFEKHGISVDLSKFMQVYQPINFAYWELYRNNKIAKEQLRYRRLKDTFDQLSYTTTDDLIFKLSIDYIRFLSNQTHLFPNAKEVLEYLAPKYRLHIITNGFTEAQYNKTKASKIDHFFECFIDSEMVGVKKPHPDIFNFALKKANTTPDKSVMIGDNIEADILGAKSVGFQVIHFNAHQEQRHDHAPMIHDLLELKQLL